MSINMTPRIWVQALGQKGNSRPHLLVGSGAEIILWLLKSGQAGPNALSLRNNLSRSVPPASSSVPLPESITHSFNTQILIGHLLCGGTNNEQNSIQTLPLQSLPSRWGDNQITTQVCVKWQPWSSCELFQAHDAREEIAGGPDPGREVKGFGFSWCHFEPRLSHLLAVWLSKAICLTSLGLGLHWETTEIMVTIPWDG